MDYNKYKITVNNMKNRTSKNKNNRSLIRGLIFIVISIFIFYVLIPSSTGSSNTNSKDIGYLFSSVFMIFGIIYIILWLRK